MIPTHVLWRHPMAPAYRCCGVVIGAQKCCTYPDKPHASCGERIQRVELAIRSQHVMLPLLHLAHPILFKRMWQMVGATARLTAILKLFSSVQEKV